MLPILAPAMTDHAPSQTDVVSFRGTVDTVCRAVSSAMNDVRPKGDPLTFICGGHQVQPIFSLCRMSCSASNDRHATIRVRVATTVVRATSDIDRSAKCLVCIGTISLNAAVIRWSIGEVTRVHHSSICSDTCTTA